MKIITLMALTILFSLTLSSKEAESPQKSIWTSVLESRESLRFALTEGLLQSKLAKDICSCHFISGIPQRECEIRSGLASTARRFGERFQVKNMTKEANFVSIVIQGDDVTVAPRKISNLLIGTNAPTVVATYNSTTPTLGCRISKFE